MTPTETRTWLTRQEAAGRAGVDIRTVDAWLADGTLTRYRVGRRAVRIDQEQLDALRTPTPDAPRSA